MATRESHTRIAAKIKAGMIIGKLQKHVSGEEKMSSTQIRAAEILLSRVCPVLKSVEHSGMIETRDARDLSREELLNIASAGSAGNTEKGRGGTKSNPVH